MNSNTFSTQNEIKSKKSIKEFPNAEFEIIFPKNDSNLYKFIVYMEVEIEEILEITKFKIDDNIILIRQTDQKRFQHFAELTLEAENINFLKILEAIKTFKLEIKFTNGYCINKNISVLNSNKFSTLPQHIKFIVDIDIYDSIYTLTIVPINSTFKVDDVFGYFGESTGYLSNTFCADTKYVSEGYTFFFETSSICDELKYFKAQVDKKFANHLNNWLVAITTEDLFNNDHIFEKTYDFN